MFQIQRVDQLRSEAVEPLGTKRKFWFRDDNRKFLFKAEERGTGEDWAEKVACHLCELLGLPHVHYELAELYDGERYIQPGVVCETCAGEPLSLILGNQLLLTRDPTYPADKNRKYKVREHTVQAVVDVIQDLTAPADEWMVSVPAGIETALDVFVGYVMLDAWIANPDRHHQNWAALSDDQMRLAPTFDHGASLARNISDEERDDRLTTNDRGRSIPHFAARARSAFYSDPTEGRPLNTLDAFVAFARHAPAAAKVWINKLANVEKPAIRTILDEVPPTRLSRIAKDFMLQLLLVNQQRIREAEIA